MCDQIRFPILQPTSAISDIGSTIGLARELESFSDQQRKKAQHREAGLASMVHHERHG